MLYIGYMILNGSPPIDMLVQEFPSRMLCLEALSVITEDYGPVVYDPLDSGYLLLMGCVDADSFEGET